MQNEYKTYICTFSSFFSYIYIQKYSEGSVSSFASDYCNTLDDIELQKVTFVSSLASISLDDRMDFYNYCMDALMQYAEYNSWIDPMIAIEDVSVGTMCQNVYTLYKQMENDEDNYNDDGNIPFEYYLVKTNSLIMLEYVNAIELRAFSACANTYIATDGYESYCADTVMNYIDFWIWD